MKNYIDSKISLVIPCRNEAGTIGLAIEKGVELPGVRQIIVIEGDSTDKTHQIAKKYLEKINNSVDKSFFIQSGTGKWDAVSLGIKNAKYDYISIWDADLTVSPDEQEMIHKVFLQARESQQDILVSGNRMANREPGAMKFFNVIGNYFFGYLWNITAKQPVNDSLCGSKIFNKSILNLLPGEIKNIDPYGDFSLIASSILANQKIISVPITYRARTYGQTNISRWRGGIKLLIVWVKIYKYTKLKLK